MIQRIWHWVLCRFGRHDVSETAASCRAGRHEIKMETEFQRLVVESGMPVNCCWCNRVVYGPRTDVGTTRWNS